MFVGTTIRIETEGRPAAFRQAVRDMGLRLSSRMPWLRFRRNGGMLEVFREVERPSEENGWAAEFRLAAVLNPQSSLAHRITRA